MVERRVVMGEEMEDSRISLEAASVIGHSSINTGLGKRDRDI